MSTTSMQSEEVTSVSEMVAGYMAVVGANIVDVSKVERRPSVMWRGNKLNG